MGWGGGGGGGKGGSCSDTHALCMHDIDSHIILKTSINYKEMNSSVKCTFFSEPLCFHGYMYMRHATTAVCMHAHELIIGLKI